MCTYKKYINCGCGHIHQWFLPTLNLGSPNATVYNIMFHHNHINFSLCCTILFHHNFIPHFEITFCCTLLFYTKTHTSTPILLYTIFVPALNKKENIT